MPFPDEVVQSLPEDIRGNPTLGKFNDVGALAKSYVELESYRGKSIGIPGNDPKEIEAWKTEHLPKVQHVFADRLPPAKPEDYQFKFEGVDDEALKTDKVIQDIQRIAHKRGLSQSQAAGTVEDLVKEILPQIIPKNNTPPIEFIQGENVDALMQEVFRGESTQRIAEYKQSVDLLSRDIPELKDLLNEGAAPYGQASEHKAMALGDHPAMVKLIGLVAKMTQPDFGGSANGSMSVDGKAAALEAHDIIRNKDNPKYKAYHAGDPDVSAYVESLMKKGYPGTLEI